MPRKGGVVKRPVPQDLKYNDILVSRFINGLMERGKKSTAQCILYNAMEIVGQRGNDSEAFDRKVRAVKLRKDNAPPRPGDPAGRTGSARQTTLHRCCRRTVPHKP